MTRDEVLFIPIGRRTRLVINVVAFQAAWFATALGAAHGAPWIGPLAVASVIVLHLAMTPGIAAELNLLIFAFLLGVPVEYAMFWSGLIQYAGHGDWVPVWMLALWPLFATTLNVSLRWFQGHLLLAAVVGFVAGPMAYLGGQTLGALQLPDTPIALAFLAVVWAVALPSLSSMAHLLRVLEPRPEQLS